MAPARRRPASPVLLLVWAHPTRVLPPAVRPRRPRLLCRRGLCCVRPACLVVLSDLVVGPPDVAPPPENPFSPQNEFCVCERFPGGSLARRPRWRPRGPRFLGAPIRLPGAPRCPPWGPAAPSAGAAHPVFRPGPAHFGTLADPRHRPAPLRGSLAGGFPDRAWKALNGWAAGYVLLWSAYPLPWMFSRRENFYRRMGCFPAYAGKLYFV